MPDHDDRQELQELCDQFRRGMARDIERTVFDKDACQRIGQLIGRAALVGSEYSYPASLGPRISIYHIPGRDPSQSSQCSTEANPS